MQQRYRDMRHPRPRHKPAGSLRDPANPEQREGPLCIPHFGKELYSFSAHRGKTHVCRSQERTAASTVHESRRKCDMAENVIPVYPAPWRQTSNGLPGFGDASEV